MLKPHDMTWEEWEERNKHLPTSLKPAWHSWDDWKVLIKEDLVYYDGPLVVAQVGELNYKSSLGHHNSVRFLLSYYTGEYPENHGFIDPDGYVHVRWSESDIKNMLKLIQTEKNKIKKAKRLRRKVKKNEK
jgi:hypothetical protein